MASISETLLRRRAVVLFLLLAASLFLGYKALKLRRDFSLDSVFLRNDPEVAYRDQFRQEFVDSSNIAVILLTLPNGGEEKTFFTAEGLRRLEKLTDALEHKRGVRETTSLTNAEHVVSDADSFTVEELVEEIPEDPGALAELERQALSDELFERRLISADGRTTAVMVEVDDSEIDDDALPGFIDEIRDLARRTCPASWKVQETGPVVVKAEYDVIMKREQSFFLGLTSAIMMVILYIIFRSAFGVVLPMAAILLTLVWTMGGIVLLGGKMNIISQSIPTLILVIGISTSIHILNRYYEAIRAGLVRREAVLITLKEMGVACLMTNVTTAVGFFSLLTARIEMIQKYGLYAGMGVLLGYIVTLTLVPLALSILPPPRVAPTDSRKSRSSDALLDWIGRRNLHHRALVLAASGAVVAIAALTASRVTVNGHMLSELKKDNRVYKANQFAEKKLAGALSFEIAVEGPERDSLKAPAVLRAMEQVEAKLESSPYINKTLSIVDFLKQMNRAFHGGDPKWYVLPETRELVAQYLLLYSFSGEDSGLDDFVNYDYSRARIHGSREDSGLNAYYEIYDAVTNYGEKAMPPGYRLHVTGTSYVAVRAFKSIIHDMLTSLLSAFVIISVFMALTFRSVRLGLLAMIPNVIPLLVTVAVMALLDIYLRTATLVVFSLTLGIAVDDTVHYLARFRIEFARDRNYAAAMHRTLHTTGRAMIFTTVILVLGFSVFLTSDFVGIMELGLLGSITLASALLADLFLLPVLVNLVHPFGPEGEAEG